MRLEAVMWAARLLKVPVCPHQEYLAPQNLQERVGREEPGEGGRIINLALRRVGVPRDVDHQ